MPRRLERLPRHFYRRPTLRVARDLVGMYLCRRQRGELLVGRIVEVEAYLGERDPASHAYRGMTPRNAVMFEPGGRLYVYFTYGMHFCSNVVTEEKGRGKAVLLRALAPVQGISAMKRRRGTDDEKELCNGPAKLCQAFGIGKAENGTDLCGTSLWIARDRFSPPLRIRRSTRVGITTGTRHRWRFYARENPYVSRGKPVTAGAEPL
jgi:DNA-3-methyladenine glycosylase